MGCLMGLWVKIHKALDIQGPGPQALAPNEPCIALLLINIFT